MSVTNPTCPSVQDTEQDREVVTLGRSEWEVEAACVDRTRQPPGRKTDMTRAHLHVFLKLHVLLCERKQAEGSESISHTSGAARKLPEIGVLFTRIRVFIGCMYSRTVCSVVVHRRTRQNGSLVTRDQRLGSERPGCGVHTTCCTCDLHERLSLLAVDRGYPPGHWTCLGTLARLGRCWQRPGVLPSTPPHLTQDWGGPTANAGPRVHSAEGVALPWRDHSVCITECFEVTRNSMKGSERKN